MAAAAAIQHLNAAETNYPNYSLSENISFSIAAAAVAFVSGTTLNLISLWPVRPSVRPPQTGQLRVERVRKALQEQDEIIWEEVALTLNG